LEVGVLAVGVQMRLFEEFVEEYAQNPGQETSKIGGSPADPHSRTQGTRKRKCAAGRAPKPTDNIGRASAARESHARAKGRQPLTIAATDIRARLAVSDDPYLERRFIKWLDSLGAASEELPLLTVLDALGIEDAVWTLTAVRGHRNAIRLFTLKYAWWALHLFEERFPHDRRPRWAIETAEMYVNSGADIVDVRTASEEARQAAEEAESEGSENARRAVWLIWKIVAKPAYEAYRADWELRDITYTNVLYDWEDTAEAEFKSLSRLEGRYGTVLEDIPLFQYVTI